ncbi:MAG: ABC transporter permease, partial [Chloroflexota bacterium]|nr:ABC transporter permease [Chloroflexota bacterium]
PATRRSARSRDRRPLLLDVLHSEWTKLRSVRSTYWTLLAAAAVTIGLGAILSVFYIHNYTTMSAADWAGFEPTSYALSGLFLAQLAIGVLGALVITSEYGTGMIRTTFAVVPQRRLVLGAKALVFTAVTGVTGVVSCLVGFFLSQAILSTHHLQTTIGAPGVLRAVIGGGLYLAVLGLLAFGIGAIIRHTAGAISAVFGLVLVVPTIALFLPSSWSNEISPYLPSNAGRAVFSVGHQAHTLAPWTGLAVFCAYAVIALLVAGFLLTRRDA